VQTPLNLQDVSDQIVAVAALGTAAFGLVDASKAFWGGISNVGFGYVKRALLPFDEALTGALGTDNAGCDWRSVLRSHWINGRPKEEQKAIAVSLIQLGLTPETAEKVAPAAHVGAAEFGAVVAAMISGGELSEAQVNLLGRFKAAVEARMDAAYERADQAYRNAARLAAGIASVLLAILAWYLFYPGTRLLSAVVVGLVAVPLAPIAKDLVSTLTAAAKAIGARVAP
jgi:hypothetical protein